MGPPSLLVPSWSNLGPGIDFSVSLPPVEDKGKVADYLSVPLSDDSGISGFNLNDDIDTSFQIDVEVTDETPGDIEILYPIPSDQIASGETSLTKVLRSFKKIKNLDNSTGSSQLNISNLLYADSSFDVQDGELSCRVASIDDAPDLSLYSHERFECKDCGRKFKEKRNLSSHLRAHVTVRKYMCSDCDKCFKTKSNLKVHLTTHSNTPFDCEVCGKTFPTRNKLHRHRRVTHWNNHFECNHCGKVLKSERSLRTHCASHSTNSKPFQCTLCPSGFIFKNTLLAHIKLKHSCAACSEIGGRCSAHAFTCDKCGKSFSCQASLSVHVRKHDSAKPHKCPTCGQCYAKKDSLETHVKKTHNQEQPQFICDKCSLGYYTKFSLQRHYAKHTSSKPFVCELCKRSFWTKDALKAHGRSHEAIKKFVCPVCGKRFTHKHSVVAHIQTHSESANLTFVKNRMAVKAAEEKVKHRRVQKSGVVASGESTSEISSYLQAPQAVPVMGEWLQPKSPPTLQTLCNANEINSAYQDLSHTAFSSL